MAVLIVTPTYNEAENIRKLISSALGALPDAHILVVDDNSPDGTGRLVDSIAADDGRIHALHRAQKSGLGRAYVAGLTWGLARRYDKFITMDADLSHDPIYLPNLVAASETCDIAIGSRYIRGGRTKNWHLHRWLLSRGANFYFRTLLASDTLDMTGGFRCWNRHALEDIDLPTIRSHGFSYTVETLYRAHLCGHSATEVPITFVDRVKGRSKLDRKVVTEAIGLVLQLRRTEGPQRSRSTT